MYGEIVVPKMATIAETYLPSSDSRGRKVPRSTSPKSGRAKSDAPTYASKPSVSHLKQRVMTLCASQNLQGQNGGPDGHDQRRQRNRHQQIDRGGDRANVGVRVDGVGAHQGEYRRIDKRPRGERRLIAG
jgi:hypothetical protein